MASKINKGEILAKFFDDGEYTALFADGAVSAACGYAAGQQAYAVYQNGEAVTVKDVEKNIKVLEMAAQTGCPVVTFYNSVGAKLAEGLDVLTASAKLNAQIAKVSGVVPQVAVVLGVCGGTSALSAANADVCIMAEGAELFFTAPFTSAAKGDKVADAGSAAAAAKAGVASIVAADAAEAAEKAAHIVGLLPANNLTGPAIFEFEQPTAVLAAGAEPAKAAAAADPYTYTHKLQKPLDYEGKHYESLTFDWGKLTGNDSLAIEAELTALNQPVIIPSMSAGYLIRMACRACTEPIGVDVIGAMSIRDYNTIRTKARNFLLRSDL